MPKYINILLFLVILCHKGFAQSNNDSTTFKLITQYTAAINYTDAAINSISALNSLIKKENYRNKISSFNNPTSNELGFNLELEIQNALKPIMDKTSKSNASKLSGVVNSVMQTGKTGASLFPVGNVFTSLISMVGSVTVQEKKVKRIWIILYAA